MRVIAVALVLVPLALFAVEDVYCDLAVGDLAIEGEWPESAPAVGDWRMLATRRPYVVLDGPGEAYIAALERGWEDAEDYRTQGRISLRVPGGAHSGVIVLPHGGGMVALRFAAAPADGGADARAAFARAREAHYRRLWLLDSPGGAWFRYQVETGRRARGEAADLDAAWQGRPIDDTFELFTGGRAVAENLQLDVPLAATDDAAETTAIADIEGITVAAMDWAPLLAGRKPETDALAVLIPNDQHALFFPTFAALTAAMDRIDALATPIGRAMAERAEDALTRERYQRQLCLEMSELARRFGSQIVDSVAITGSDASLRLGSDVAVLFAPKQREALVIFLAGKHAAAASAGARVVSGRIGAVAWSGVVDDARTVSSYLAMVSDAVVMTNSLAQLERIAATAAGGAALAGEPEYAFFRDRYRRDDGEAMLLVLSDATIRRWCSPAWRIGESRRLRAAAELARLNAAHIAGEEPVAVSPTLGTVDWTADGPRSSRQGSLAFHTPLIELLPTRCSAGEAESYGRFRDGYQSRWRGWFDPIALRLGVGDDGAIDADLTVIPLIGGSEYRQFIELIGAAVIAPGAGDPHAGTLLHWTMAIDRASSPVQEVSSMATGYAPGIGIDALGWLGSSISIYADADPVWVEALAAMRRSDMGFIESNLARLPIALTAEVDDGLKLAAFLTAIRGFADQAAPGMVEYQTLTHDEQPYVRVAQAGGGGIALYYAATPKRFVLTPNEDLLKRALTRQAAAKKPAEVAAAAPTPWLGDHLCLRADAQAMAVIEVVDPGSSPVTQLQFRSWANLPILNEWRRLFPDEDPVAAHERLWHTRLTCPGGGTYAWNARWGTMESTVFGHPGEPRMPERMPIMVGIGGVDCGIGFIDGGLRARLHLAPGDGAAMPVEESPDAVPAP